MRPFRGLLIVYDAAQPVVAVDNDPADGWRVETAVGAGAYYVRGYTAGGYSTTDAYTLRAAWL